MSDPAIEQRAEAARYALLRRLAYALRHHVAGHLQPIGMITDVMQRRLQAPAPDIAQIHESLGKVNAQARTAVQASLDVVAWIAPDPAQLLPLAEGVEQCVELLRSYLNFRGFSLRSDLRAMEQPVPQTPLRTVLPAALLALTDHGESPADVAIDGRCEDKALLVTVTLRPNHGSPGFGGDLHYRAIEWSDVEAIAAAEGVRFAHEGGAVTLGFAA